MKLICRHCGKEAPALHANGYGTCCFDFDKYIKRKQQIPISEECQKQQRIAKRKDARIRRRANAKKGLTTKGKERVR